MPGFTAPGSSMPGANPSGSAKTRRADSGVVLVTILIVMALCVTVIVAMTLQSEATIRLTARQMDAAQARALEAAGEASALSALTLDLQTAPEADAATEAWARAGQSDVATSLGHFQMAIFDQAAWFNLNTLIAGSPAARAALGSIVAAAGLPPEVGVRIAAALQGGRPLLRLGDLAARAGLTGAELAALAGFVTCTPELTAAVNINAAPEALLGALLRNADTTARIVAARKTGMITPDGLRQLGIILPAGLSVRSDVFGLRIVTTSGEASAHATVLIHRWRDPDGTAHAVVAGRTLEAP